MALGTSNIILIGCAVATAAVVYLGSQKGSAASYHDDSSIAGATTTPVEPAPAKTPTPAATRSATPGPSSTPTAVILTLGQVRNLPRPATAVPPTHPFVSVDSGSGSTPSIAPGTPASIPPADTPPSEATPTAAPPAATPIPAATQPWMATPPALPPDWPAPENPFHAPPPHE